MWFVLLSKDQKVLFGETLPSSNLHARSGQWQGLSDQPSSPWGPRKLEKVRQGFSLAWGWLLPGWLASSVPTRLLYPPSSVPSGGNDSKTVLWFEGPGRSLCPKILLNRPQLPANASPTCPAPSDTWTHPWLLLSPASHSPRLVHTFRILHQAFSVSTSKALVQTTTHSPLDPH